jgi:hypothetical protein
MQLRLNKSHFTGPKTYSFVFNGEDISLAVDEHGIFEADKPSRPWHAIASIVGSDRDNPY